MIFLDRDGTLNPDPGYINSIDQFSLYDFTLPALKQLSDNGARFCIVTNQSGVARGIIDPIELERIHQFVRAEFARNGVNLMEIYFCTDHPDCPTEFRKPGSGMFLQAAREHGLDLSHCLMVGDTGKDIIAGNKLGMDTMLVLTGEGQKTLGDLPDSIKPTFIAADLLDGAEQLVAE